MLHSPIKIYPTANTYTCTIFSGYFPLPAQLCALWVTMDVLMCTASIWHMCTMSMDRYFTLKYPMQYGRNKTKTMVAIKILFVWVVSVAISSPICIYGLVDSSSVYTPDQMCLITLPTFKVVGSIFAFYIPLSIMILTYLLTVQILWKNQNLMKTIERSDFKLRQKHGGFSGSCHVTTLVSPPSSESRRESHTDISSLARTPNREKVNLDNELEATKLKNLLDNAYINSQCTNLSNGVYEKGNDCSKDNTDDTSFDKTEESSAVLDDTNENQFIAPITNINIQGPSEDEAEADEYSSLLNGDGLSRCNSMSPSLPRFRLRTNTDITSSNHPNTHSSLKIPKFHEKQGLQASVSCSNFSQNKDSESMFKSVGLANRDYKSLEWCHHFYEIQEEMDQCLREAKLEKKEKAMKTKGIAATMNDASLESTQKDELKPDVKSREVSESGDSMDDVESSSDNNSDLVTIKLYPKSVYMYKLNVPAKSSATPDPADQLSSDVRIKRGSVPRGNSVDSDKSLEISRKIRKRASIRQFLTTCKRKNFISTKTNTNEKKASKVLGIIFAVFVILWTPFFFANFLMGVCEACEQYFSPIMMSSFVWMGYIASLANPIIYTMFNTAFRRTFKRILRCDLCKKHHRRIQRSSVPSFAASIYNDRRKTLTVLLNGNHHRGNENGSAYSTSYGR